MVSVKFQTQAARSEALPQAEALPARSPVRQMPLRNPGVRLDRVFFVPDGYPDYVIVETR